MADTIKAVPNKISISGHTDAKPYTGTGDFGNWELSANRANAARRALVAGSYPDRRWRGSWVMPRRRCSTRKPVQPGQPPHRHRGPDQKGPSAIEGSQGADAAPAAEGQNGAARRRRSIRTRCRQTATGTGPRVARTLEPVRRRRTETGRAGTAAPALRHCTGPCAEAVTDKKPTVMSAFCGWRFRNRVESGFSVVHGTDRRCAYRYH
jgi:hypothetical protein